MAFARTVISWTARCAKSTSFSGWLNAKLPSPTLPAWPVSVDAAAYPRLSAVASAPYEIVPAQPPLPTPSNFPFHPDDGIQTSILISESLDGFSVASTRQKAGRLANACGAGPGGGAALARAAG